MKNALLLVVLFVLVPHTVCAQSFDISLKNISDHNLAGITIVIGNADLPAAQFSKLDSTCGVFAGSVELPSQWCPDVPPSFVFVAPSVEPGQQRDIQIRIGARGKIGPIAAAKYVLPRKDVAWENDRMAHRIYGGPLAGDVKDGIDVWVKRVRYPIIDNWYNGDSLKGKKRISYHVDHGEGADYFDVKKSLGAGGSGLWTDGVVNHFGFFRSQSVVASGPVRAQFIVTYDSAFVSGTAVTCIRKYTLDAGSNLTRIDLKIDSPSPADSIVALGLVKRENIQTDADAALGVLSSWGLIDKDSTHGELGIAVVIDPASVVTIKSDSTHFYLLARLGPDKQLTYYAGAGWTKSGDFSNRAAWNNYLLDFRKPKYVIVQHGH